MASTKDSILADIVAGKFLDNLTAEKIEFLRKGNSSDKAEIIYALVYHCASFNPPKTEPKSSHGSTVQQSAIHSAAVDQKFSSDTPSLQSKDSNENPGDQLLIKIINALIHICEVNLHASHTHRSDPVDNQLITPFQVLAHRKSPFDTPAKIRERIRMLQDIFGFNINARFPHSYNLDPALYGDKIRGVLSEAIFANNRLAFDMLREQGANLFAPQMYDVSAASAAPGNTRGSALELAYRFADHDFFQHILTQMRNADAKLTAELQTELVRIISSQPADLLDSDKRYNKKKLLIQSPATDLGLGSTTDTATHPGHTSILDGIIAAPPAMSPFWAIRGTVVQEYSERLSYRLRGIHHELNTACANAFPEGVANIVLTFDVGQGIFSSNEQGNAFLCLANINYFAPNYLFDQQSLEKRKQANRETNDAELAAAAAATAASAGSAAAERATGAAADMKSSGDTTVGAAADMKSSGDTTVAVAVAAAAADSKYDGDRTMSMFSYFKEYYVDDATHPATQMGPCCPISGTANAATGAVSDRKSAADLNTLQPPQPAAILAFYNAWTLGLEKEREVDAEARLKQEAAVAIDAAAKAEDKDAVATASDATIAADAAAAPAPAAAPGL